MKNQSAEEVLNEILLRMNYDSRKTLSENREIISEQASGYERSLERSSKEQISNTSQTNQEVKLKPGEVDITDTFTKVPGHIAMATPDGKGYIWIPSSSKYSLFYIPIQDLNYLDWEKSGLRKPSDEEINSLIKPNTLRSFTTPTGEKYWYLIIYDNETTLYQDGYYATAQGKKYESPKVIDIRTDWQKFLDEHDLAFQIAGSLIVFILGGIATGGLGASASLGILFEILGEMAINIPVAVREIQRGENVSAGISFLFAILPLIKNTAGLGKISNEMAKNLSEKLSKVNIKDNSEMINFISNLTNEEQIAMNIMLKQDPKNLIKITETTLNNEVVNWLKTNRKDLLGKLPFTKREWAKSLGVDVITISPLIAYKMFFGKELNVEDSRKLNGFILSFPKNSQANVIVQLVENPKLIDGAIKNPDETKKYIETLKPKFDSGVEMTPEQSDSAVLSALEYANNNIDDILTKK